MSIGFNFPFQPTTGSLGYLEVTDDVVSAIRANVRSLLLTNRGERVMHIDFGCNLREFLFEQKTRALKTRISERIKAQLAKWMPFLTLTRSIVTFTEDDPNLGENAFHIHLDLIYGNIPIGADQLFEG
jgi:phage baseplate assembly protein W